MAHPPVKLAGIAIGDGTLGNAAVYEEVPTVRPSHAPFFARPLMIGPHRSPRSRRTPS